MHKVIFVDVEATGSGQDINHGLLELGMEYWLLHEDGECEMLSTFYEKFKPHSTCVYQHDKGKHGQDIYCNLDKGQRHSLSALPLQDEAFKMTEDWFQKFIKPTEKRDKAAFIAFNADYDKKHMMNFYHRNNSNFLHSYFYPTPICIQKFACQHLGKDRYKLAGERLIDFANWFDIDLSTEELHTAAADCRIARKVYFKTWQLMIKQHKELQLSFKDSTKKY